MSSSTKPVESKQNPSRTNPSKGPSAHEDLTIAEHIEIMRLSGEHRPGEECFVDAHGEKHWVASVEVQRFIRKYGAEHPSNYLEQHDSRWEEDFFNDSKN